MIKKKVCLLGSFAVGKTSLIRYFVHSIFSEKYHTSIGVKIDRKNVRVDEREVMLMLWDIHGQDDFQEIKPSYLMGSSGIILVLDGTRKNTLEVAISLNRLVSDTLGNVPVILLLNKSDLKEQWELEEQDMAQLNALGWTVRETSAKTGEGVEEAFLSLTAQMLTEPEQ
ncbi:MAG: GTP-binding protein [bacterium]|nr:GTP-binding protein [bacterium]